MHAECTSEYVLDQTFPKQHGCAVCLLNSFLLKTGSEDVTTKIRRSSIDVDGKAARPESHELLRRLGCGAFFGGEVPGTLGVMMPKIIQWTIEGHKSSNLVERLQRYCQHCENLGDI